ncbi:MAG: PSD1 and planctomycete cytochrome C domain-containing protein [Verrucomicrobiaceae bacterium]|nr:PSD1 and planctomycete cytochrome C domain-containing protein [Verrucomicrobiaceae bacterium]
MKPIRIINRSLIVLGAAASLAHGAETFTRSQLDFFESKIRPVLADKCYACHSSKAEKLKGNLLLDTREGTRRGGDNGPAVVPGDLEKSLLIQAIRYHDPDTAMPPKNKGGKLPDSVIADFEQWVRDGAPDPREGEAKVAKLYDTEVAKNWWAYQPITKPSVPQPKDQSWAQTEIDRFILAKLEETSLRPVADADAGTLLRRVCFDLTGLPPSPDTIERFTNKSDRSHEFPLSYEAIVDDLLASPEFGRRWARHWLDVARYAETSGRDVNVVFPEAWRYRDYVIEAFQEDKPFDQLIREQIAGDLLPDRSDEERAKNLTATGFLALGPKSLNETNPRQFAVDLADEQIDATSQAFMGVTIACARCHDHKFDPISQRDYTALAGIFLSTDTRFGTPGGVQARNAASLITVPDSLNLPIVNRRMDPAVWRQKSNRLASIEQQRDQALRERAGGKVRGEIEGGTSSTARLTGFDIVRLITNAKQIEMEIGAYHEDGSLIPKLMGALDRPLTLPSDSRRRRQQSGSQKSSGFEIIADSPLFTRGDITKEGEKVPRGLPAFLARDHDYRMPSTGSGRLELANWIASPRNPLTARVIVNRVWHWLFGRGLVTSVDNFGVTGAKPSHPELLDFLATRFVEQGWSIKKLVREIVLSRTYQLSASNAAELKSEIGDLKSAQAIDPDNLLLSHANVRPLDAESMRDAMLAASGSLDLKPQIGSIIALAGDGPVGGERYQAISETAIAKATGNFRSIYLPVARNVTPDVLAIFDFADPSSVLGARQPTIVPAQALYLLNNEFVHEQSQKLAGRLLRDIPTANTDALIRAATLAILGRPPFADETKVIRDFVSRHSSAPMADTWSRVCRNLFATADYRFLK